MAIGAVRLLRSGRLRLRRIQVLDEKYFVSILPIDDLID
jgi:hypothetical protein